MFAARNSKLCTKDCLCLFVCPTGATDTETGQIDPEMCIDGCRLCVDACPSHAIYLVYERLPEKAETEETITEVFAKIIENKAQVFVRAGLLSELSDGSPMSRFLAAVRHSAKVLGEDFIRESGYLFPQRNVLDEFFSSGILQRHFQGKLGGSEAVDKISELIMTALTLRKDAAAAKVFLCNSCGNLMLAEKSEKCSNCSSEDVSEVMVT